jgi:hypothetical protein
MIRERVSTENLTISTDVAPDTSRFTLNSRGSSRTISSSVADGTSGGSPSYARGHYNNATGGLGDLAESLEIEYSQDGHNAPAAAGLAAMRQQQQLQPGDFVYEFVPSVARDILSWSGLSEASAASSFGTIGTLGTLHTTLGMGTLLGTATLAAAAAAAAGDAYDPTAAAAAGLSGAGVGGGDKQQLDLLLPKRWMAGKAGAIAGVSASGDSSSKLARLANAEVGSAIVFWLIYSNNA